MPIGIFLLDRGGGVTLDHFGKSLDPASSSPPLPRVLSPEHYLQVLTCIEDVHRCRKLTEFPGMALRAVQKLIPHNLAGFNEVNLARNRMVSITDRPADDPATFVRSWDGQGRQYPLPANVTRTWEKHSAEHPLVRYVSETGDGQAVKISDFLSEDEYHRLDLYRAVYSPLFTEDQMCITIRSDHGVLIALTLSRDRRDFTEIDRVKLNLVRPHILQAYSNVEELAGHLEEKGDLQTALRETGHGLIALDFSGDPAHATPGAFACLARFFPGAEPSRPLPLMILEWLRGGAQEPLMVTSATGRLVIRRPREPVRPLLLLSEEIDRGAPPFGAGLTTREREVLAWLAEGKTNAEIAVILGVAVGTVKMHVEHILAKLDVSNRTAAAVLAREAGFGFEVKRIGVP